MEMGIFGVSDSGDSSEKKVHLTPSTPFRPQRSPICPLCGIYLKIPRRISFSKILSDQIAGPRKEALSFLFLKKRDFCKVDGSQ